MRVIGGSRRIRERVKQEKNKNQIDKGDHQSETWPHQVAR